MKKKLFTMFLSAFLALTMAFLPSMQVFAAAENGQYLSELCIGYGDDGKQRLIDAGYSIIKASSGEDFNANEGNNGNVTYIGYKTTNNPEEAITDIATMNMDGGYSFDEYSKEIDALNARVNDMLNSFEATIAEFRTNYDNGSPYAMSACDLLSKVIEDDTKKTIAELFLDDETSSDTLVNVFMQGNSDILQAIYLGLAVACTDYNPDGETETFLDRLENVEYSEEIGFENEVAIGYISTALDDFVEELKKAEKYYSEYEKYCTESMLDDISYDDYYDSITDENKRIEAEYYITLYAATDSVDYGDTGFTFFEAMMLPREHSEDNDWELDDSVIEVLAEAMTDGQAGVILQSGIVVLVLSAYCNEIDMDEYVDICLEELSDVKTVSVYAGVDRTLFTDTDSVALTSAAIREKAMNDGNTFGVNEADEKGVSEQIAILKAFGVMFSMLGIGAIIAGVHKIPSLVSELVNLTEEMQNSYLRDYLCVQITENAAVAVAGVICIAAAVVMIVFAILKAVNHEKTANINYTQIPRAIVDLKYGDDGKKSYYVYYAVKQITATEDETDSLKLYGDLNGFNNRDQWQVLYTSKDSRLGQPLLAEFLVKSDLKLSTTQSAKYVGVHDFSVELGSVNLNQYASKSTAKPIYLFVKRYSSNSNSNNRTNNNSNRNNQPMRNDIPNNNQPMRNNIPNNNLPIRNNTPFENNTPVTQNIMTEPSEFFNTQTRSYKRVGNVR